MYSKFLLRLFLLTFFALFMSCRSSDSEQNISGARRVLKINLLGSSFDDTPPFGKSISLNGIVEKRVELVDPSTYVLTEVKQETNTFKSVSLSSVNFKAIDGGGLTAGTKFRVIVYNNSGGYVMHKDYTIGVLGEDLMLDHGSTYTIVTYSFGVGMLPVISSSELGNLSSAVVNYDNTNRDFMWQRQSYTANGNAIGVLNVILSHKLSLVTVVLNASGVTTVPDGVPGFGTWSPVINNVRNARIEPHYSTGTISLSTGAMTYGALSPSGIGTSINFPGTGFGTSVVTSTPVFVNANESTNTDIFSALVSNGNGRDFTYYAGNTFNITPGRKLNVTYNIRGCGAYLGPGATNWVQIACHNLGADTTLDPFAPSASIHGGKYQWGSNGSLSQEGTNTVGQTGVRWLSQATDQAFSSAITGWNAAPLPNGTWSDASKTINDPCPVGYRVPTSTQWSQIINNSSNTVSRVGTWTDSATNYGSGIYLGRGLFLPAAGGRLNTTGAVLSRGSYGDYWSSSAVGATDANDFYFSNTQTLATSFSRNTYGMPVRCIKE